jgi:hypothetical protein
MPRLRPLPSESDAAGKPVKVSSRGKLSAEFIEALARDFEAFGPEVIARVRQENPSQYAKICADLLPKQHQVEIDSNPYGKVETMEEMRSVMVDLIIENGWGADVIARMGSPIIETKAIEATNGSQGQ